MFKQPICFEIWGGENGKYKLKDNNGEDIDKTPEDTCDRVAKALADVELKDQDKWCKQIRSILGTKFAGGGRIMANAGASKYKKEVSLINCVVASQIADSMEAIMDVAKEAALVLKAGCGIGYDFSTLRPKGTRVFGAGAGTSGVISFMKVFDVICSTILSGGGRRGSQLGALDVQHPDIEEFITAKRQDGVLRYFNVSVLITDAFMHAVEKKESWKLWFWEKTRDNRIVDEKDIKVINKSDIPYRHPEYEYFRFAEDHVEVKYGNCKSTDLFVKRVYKTLNANDLFEKMTRSTYTFNDPGFLLIDRVNQENNLWFRETIRTTNPCVIGSARLHTNLGMVKAEHLYKNQNDIKCTVDNRTLDGNFGVSVRDAVPVFKTGDKEKVFRVETKAGYGITATEWHKFYTQRGKIELKDLKVGDELMIQSGIGQFGNQGSYELGFVYGMIVGDGCFTKSGGKEWKAFIDVWGKDKELTTRLDKYAALLMDGVQSMNVNRQNYEAHFHNVDACDKRRFGSVLLARKLISLGVNPENKYELPEFIWQGNYECIAGFLRGLFQSDGHVDVPSAGTDANKRRCSVRLNSSERPLLQNVQMLLSNFGIFAPIYLRRNARDKMMPDGKGGHKSYHCKDNYEIIIGSQSRDLFMKHIGFALDYKTNKHDDFMDDQSRGTYKQGYTTVVTGITYAGEEAVYDTTQSDHNSVVFNGIVTGQCGEQPLPPNSNCLLGSMILPAYVGDAFTTKVSFDFDQFKKDIHIANRAMDNVVEISNLPFQILTDMLRVQRRHGLGFTGLGSMFNMMRLSYGSKESVALAEKIALIMAQESLLENIEVAKEKGPAPAFAAKDAREKFMQSGYMKRLLPTFKNKDQIVKDILEYGVRWSHATSIAPTGTLSLTWGNNCSNGIEPVIYDEYLRNVRESGKKTKSQKEVLDYAYYEWKQKHKDKDLPDYWKTTKDLSIKEHTDIQEVVQRWNDSSISKTINIPTDYPYEKFKDVYINGWKAKLKGMTTYRFNPEIVSGVLVQKSDLDNTQYSFALDDGSEVIATGSEIIHYDGEDHVAANLFDALKEGLYGNM